MGSFWLSIWSDDPKAPSSIPLQNWYMTIYGVLGLIQAVAVFTAVIVITIGTVRASVKVREPKLLYFSSTYYMIIDTI